MKRERSLTSNNKELFRRKMMVLEMEATVSLNLKRKSKPNLQKSLNSKMRNQYKVSNQRRINGRLSLKCSAKPCKQQEGLMMYEEVVERKRGKNSKRGADARYSFCLLY